ncbi:neprilysin-2-like [Microplitis mediator]|uniref:neprilysin-2-like n=1 Tax=Microplitis mediator TaxID=375433 RepID=UPI00255690BE|nr:neprilysin-2-like [Microplitis mediator]
MTIKLINNKSSKCLWRKRWPELERGLFVIAIIGFIRSILSINASAAVISATSPLGPTHKCMTKDCQVERLELAASIIKFRDTSVKVCDNFHGHVCGKYKANDLENIPDITELMRDTYVDNLIDDDLATSNSKVNQLIGKIHKACMDESARGDKALDVLKNVIKNLGGWPILEGEAWKEADFDWIDFISNAKKAGYNINYFIDWKPQNQFDGQNHTLRFSLETPPSHFDSSMTEDTEIQKNVYSRYIANIAKLLEGKLDHPVKDLTDQYEFERKLDDLSPDHDSERTESMTIEELQKEFPSIDWNKFVDKTLLPFLDNDDTKPTLTVLNSTATKEAIKLIENTPKRVQANYAIWKIIQYTIPFLAGEFQEAREMFHSGVDYSDMPREEYCDGISRSYAKYAAVNLYLDQFESSQETIDKMIALIKQTMIDMINDSKKLSDEDKKAAVELLEGMDSTIGQSEKFTDPKELETFYAAAEVLEDNFLQTVLNMNVFKMLTENSNKIRSEIFQYSPMTTTDINIPENYLNHLYIPVKMIPSSLFDNNQPMYMNFGAAGSHIAREMFKSLAHLGRKWSDEGEELPGEQIDCFKNIGQNITNIDLKETVEAMVMEEGIAQYIGFRVAYAAYKQYVIQSGPELGLPELSQTPEQLFWISFSHSLCYAESDAPTLPPAVDKTLPNLIDDLTLIILKNVPEISADYDCPVGSRLNPEHKCSWW